MSGPVYGGGEPNTTWNTAAWDSNWQQPSPQGQGADYGPPGPGWGPGAEQDHPEGTSTSGKGGWILAGVLGVIALLAVGTLGFVMLSGDEADPSATSASADSSQGAAAGAGGQAATAAGGRGASAPTTTVTRVREATVRETPADGTYSGTGHQVGLRSGYRNYDLPMSMTFGGVPTVEYHSLNCSARLESNGFRDGAAHYTERVTRGSCDQNGTWEIRIQSDSKILVEYDPPSAGYVVTGTFTK